jgi:hypothetical protein
MQLCAEDGDFDTTGIARMSYANSVAKASHGGTERLSTSLRGR